MKELSKSISEVLGQVVPLIIILAVVTPFVVIDTLFFPFITGKAFYFRILVEVAALLYIVWAMVDKSVRPKWSPVSITVSVFLSALTLATIFAVDPLKSFWSNYERMEGLILFLHLAAYFLIAGSVMKHKIGWWKWFFNATLVISVFVGIDAFVDFYSQEAVSGYRIFGNLGNSSYLGIYSLMHVFISLFCIAKVVGTKKARDLITDGSWVSMAFYVLVGIFNLVVMFNTGTRGSFVGLVGGMFITAILIAIFERKNKLLRNVGITLITLLVVFVTTLGLARNTNFVKNSDMLSRFAQLITLDVKSLLEIQGKARALLVGIAWDGVKERPIVGWGLDNFHYVFSAHYNPEMYGQEQWFDRSHNVFMDWLTQAGFIGLISYLSMFGAIGYVLWKKRDDESEGSLTATQRAVITGGCIAYLGHNLFVFDNLSSYVLFFSTLAFVHQYAIRSKIAEIEHSKERYSNMNGNVLFAGSLVAVVGFTYVLYAGNIQPLIANTELIGSLQSQKLDQKTKKVITVSPQAKFEHLKQSIAYNTMTNAEQTEQLSDRGAEVMASSGVTNEYKDAAHAYIVSQFESRFKRTPTDPRPIFFYAMYLERVGLSKEATVVAARMVELSPNKQSFLNFYGLLLTKNGEPAKGLVQLEKAYTLDTTNKEAFYAYLSGLVANGQYVKAETLASTTVSTFISNGYVLDAYVSTKQVGRVVALLGKEIAANPNSVELRSNLASVYLKAGNVPAAIATLLEIKKIAPQLGANIDQAIAQVKAQAGIK